jgi:hypothetical protein
MEGLFHLTSSLADDFLHDRLSERDRSAVTLHLEECQDCRSWLYFLSQVRSTQSVLDFIENGCKALEQK